MRNFVQSRFYYTEFGTIKNSSGSCCTEALQKQIHSRPAVLFRFHADMFFKHPCKMAQVGKSKTISSFGNRKFFFFQQTGGFFHPKTLIVAKNAVSENLFEQAL
jgi:hypothetical protein